MKIRREEHMAGGNGHVIIKEILDAEQLNGKCGLYAQVTLEPGCSLGYHEHHGESETYYILQGQGEYNDNGTYRPVKAGDITFTPDNHGHALANTGNTDIKAAAHISYGNNDCCFYYQDRLIIIRNSINQVSFSQSFKWRIELCTEKQQRSY